ncbi:glutamate racemase [Kallotenue papyrolyticum]|uniref:glutamate racemase n=1 Tax=Kallotenue papyrolyticum TaxID=1325125 RepID=UPI0004785616|nr:glutamate racemase [Kallotenue papyrolyticum]
MAPSAYGPIGVFDSGVGGLSVLRDIRAALPHETLLYVADSGHVPYGNKTPGYIQQRSLALSRFLLAQGAKAIVIACNTATAAAAALLRATFDVPIVGMEPAVKPATAATRSGVVGVLATVGTLQSARFAALLDRFGQGVTVVTQPCPGLPEQVEAGDLDGPTTRALVERYTRPLLERGADTIVLGCTHYPFLRPLIADVVGPAVALIDTGAAVARQLRRVLEARDLLSPAPTPGSERFWTSGDLVQAQRVITTLWGRPVEVQPVPAPYR